MLSFNITAIDIILVVAVIILTILYLKRIQEYPEELSYPSLTKNLEKQNYTPNFHDRLMEIPTFHENITIEKN